MALEMGWDQQLLLAALVKPPALLSGHCASIPAALSGHQLTLPGESGSPRRQLPGNPANGSSFPGRLMLAKPFP